MLFCEPSLAGFLSLANLDLRFRARKKSDQNQMPARFRLTLTFLINDLLGRFLFGKFEWWI